MDAEVDVAAVDAGGSDAKGDGCVLVDAGPLCAQCGWDYDLRRECVTTASLDAGPDGNVYLDLSQCGDGGVHHWLISNESETTYGKSCPGPSGQSLPVNVDGGALSLNWISYPDGDGGTLFTVNLKTDFVNNAMRPCDANAFTFFAFKDEYPTGGPYPSIDHAEVRAVVAYADYLPPPPADSGAGPAGARMIAGFEGYWGGTFHWVEIDLHADGYIGKYADPLLVTTDYNPTREFVLLDGEHLKPPITVASDASATSIDVPWGSIIDDLTKRTCVGSLVDGGPPRPCLTPPPFGWQPPTAACGPTAMTSAYVGTEVHGLGIANLYATQFRIIGN